MNIPIIALDVDGVLSPLVNPSAPLAENLGGWSSDEWVQGPSTVFSMFMAKPVLQFLRNVTEAGTAQVAWHTTWREDAQLNLAPTFDLPHWPLLDTANVWRTSEGWWKYDVVKDAVASGERVIWIDDDIADSLDSGEISGALLLNPNIYMVAPAIQVGISRHDLSKIEAKLKEWNHE